MHTLMSILAALVLTAAVSGCHHKQQTQQPTQQQAEPAFKPPPN